QDALQYITIMAIPPAALSISILCLMLAVRRKIIRPTVAASILVALLFLEVKLYLVKLENPTRYDPFTKAPYVEFLEKDPERVRVIGLDFILPPALSGVFGLYDLGNFNAVCVRRYTDFFRMYFTPLNESTIKMLRQEGDKADMLDLCNVKYILTAGYLNGLSESLAYDEEIKIYENPGYFPRAFLADRAIWVPHVREVFETLESGVIDLKRTVVLESSEPHPAESVAVEHPVTPVGDAEITEYRENQVRIRTRTSSGSYLVLLDTFYPGWKAYVDGTPTKIMPAYYLFRAVRVPAGQHEVVFKYSPVSYKIGVLISLLGLFGTIWVTSRTS
ncbi:MAG: YfhO family protein, partial [Candidatus Hydrogenedentota bacterium]